MKVLLTSGIGYQTHTLPEIEALARKLGYDGLELMLPPRHVPPEQARRDTAYHTLTQPVPVIHAPTDIYDQPRFRASLDVACDVATITQTPIITIHPPAWKYGGRKNLEDGMTYIKNKEQETGLVIAYEVLVNPAALKPDRRPFFLEQQAYFTVRDWIDDVKKYSLHACLDTTHLASWGEDPAAPLAKLGSHLVHVHVSDYNHKNQEEHLLPGTGDIDLAKFLQTLPQTHPGLSLTLEVQPGDTVAQVEAAAQAGIEYINHTLDKTRK